MYLFVPPIKIKLCPSKRTLNNGFGMPRAWESTVWESTVWATDFGSVTALLDWERKAWEPTVWEPTIGANDFGSVDSLSGPLYWEPEGLGVYSLLQSGGLELPISHLSLHWPIYRKSCLGTDDEGTGKTNRSKELVRKYAWGSWIRQQRPSAKQGCPVFRRLPKSCYCDFS